jgi:hypothetical protein
MRDYLKIWEIEEVLEATNLSYKEIKLIMMTMCDTAETCLCAAHSSSECTCGAWDGE